MVASHADSDHIGGLIGVLEATDIAVNSVLYNGYPGDTQTWNDFVIAVSNKGLSLTSAQFPDELNWDTKKVFVLNPRSGLINPETNEASLVLLLDDAEVEFLFTGDIDSAVESEIVARGTPVTADILKVAHHGSNYSSSTNFLNAVQPYGEYEYEAILKKLGGYGFVVISEQRSNDTDSLEYARKITEQATVLLKAGVPARNITVVGASKGAGIVIYVSHILENNEINFVIMGICHPDTVERLKQDQIFLYGNVLSIYDSTDELAGSCQELFSFSEGKGISRYNEVVLHIGTGHGILFKSLDEWVIPVIQWAGKQ